MSDPEEKSKHKIAVEPIAIVVNQESSDSSRVKAYSTEMDKEPSDGLHKRSKMPAIPSVAEELKEEGGTHIEVNKDESSERNIQTQADTAPKHLQASSMLSAHSRVPEIIKPYETIVLGTLESEPVIKIIPSEPRPLEIKPAKSRGSVRDAEGRSDEDLSEDGAVLPSREATRISNWSDEQEAGGLPRSESRSSRVSRAVRQLFCCGVAYAPASEDDIPTSRAFSGI